MRGGYQDWKSNAHKIFNGSIKRQEIGLGNMETGKTDSEKSVT